MKKMLSKISAISVVVFILISQIAMVPAFAAPETVYYCSVCHENGVLGNLQHRIEPTCGDEGFEIYACNYAENNVDCPGTITVKVAETGEHVGDGNTVEAVPADCTNDGHVAYELCTYCGAYLQPGTANEIKDIVQPKNGHDYGEEVVEPDCLNGGYTIHTCSVCGDTYNDTETDANGHDFSKEVTGKAATCREPGYTGYVECAVCGQIDPDNPKQVLPIEDHNGKITDQQAATCTENGYNVFKCEKAGCPYAEGVTETIKATGHEVVKYAKKEATCTESGHGAYEKCKNCDYTTYDRSTEVAPLGHTTVNKGYVAPTCTEKGMTDAIICDRCQFPHHAGEEIPANGHNLVAVNALDATCTREGNIAHTKCTVCNKLFGADAESGDPSVTPITNVVISALGHDYRHWADEPTCTEKGYNIYTCIRITADGTECGHTYSTEIAANGHSFAVVSEVPATCGVDGTKAHNKCTVCEKLYAIDATENDITAVELTSDALVIDKLDHVAETVTAINPTYNNAGNEAGSKCKLCNAPLQNAEVLEELDEAVKFKYDILGVNGADVAVNSGYITLNIYFDVLADADDKAEYTSDVLANVFAVDFAMNFDSSALTLTNVAVAPGAFAKAAFTPLDIANGSGNIAITQDMVNTFKVFRGENNLFATLTFQVATDAPAGEYSFNTTNILVIHPEEEDIDANTSEMTDSINIMCLGDANGDGIFTSADSLIVSNYIKNPDIEKLYVAEYDMDKDGDVDFIDLDLLRKAIVGNNEYLTITTDPNAVNVAEV